MHGRAAFIRDEVTVNFYSDPIRIFLWGVTVDNDQHGSLFWSCHFCNIDIFMCHYEHLISAFLACFIVSLRHSAKIFPKSHLPCLSSVRVIHQLLVFFGVEEWHGACIADVHWFEGSVC